MADIKVLMVNSEVKKFECIEYLALRELTLITIVSAKDRRN